MMKNIKKILIALVVSAIVCSPLAADSAKVTFVKGKVEVNRGGNWVQLKVGDTIAEKETVSTGFQSEARLNLNGSVLAVAAMSRVTLETLKSTDSKNSVSVYIDTGATRSKVNHADNKKVDYTTRTAVAVASVRGTDYIQIARGNVTCLEGAVAVYSAKEWAESLKKLAEAAKKAAEDGELSDVIEDIEITTDEAASATTPAVEIYIGSPDGAVVVAAGQTVSFDNLGRPETPRTTAEVNINKEKNNASTAGEDDLIRTGGDPAAKKDHPYNVGTFSVTIDPSGLRN